MFSPANAGKSTLISPHETIICRIATGYPSSTNLAVSELDNIPYFLSHDIQCILYLVILYDNIPSNNYYLKHDELLHKVLIITYYCMTNIEWTKNRIR